MKTALVFLVLILLQGALLARPDINLSSGPGSAPNSRVVANSPVPRTILELIHNGGCEADLVQAEIPDWNEVVGSNWTQRGTNPSPQEGQHYFFPGVASDAELAQDIDVSYLWYYIDGAGQQFDFSGYVRSYSQSPADLTRIIVEYLNADKTVVLDSYDSGTNSNTNDWLLLTDNRVAPVGTRHIRIRLISTRRNGSNNDGYFDNLSLLTELIKPLAPQNLSIQRLAEDIMLDWDAVIQDELGNPVTISHYLVYADDTPDFVCSPDKLVATVTSPGITLIGLADTHSKSFFKVTAFRSLVTSTP